MAGWQDAPVVQSAASAQPAWANAPVVSQGTGHSPITNALAEPTLNVVTGAIAAPVAGLRGIYDLATGQSAEKASADISSTEKALTFEPRTKVGKAATDIVTYPFAELGKAADLAGGKVAEVTGSPALGAATNVAVQAIPAVVGAKIMKGESESAPANPEDTARAYVAQHTALDWNALSDKFKSALTTIAKDAKRLDNLDPQAVERQARLERLGVPATRGQITRDLPQLTREENITKTDAGSGIRDIYAEQDRILHENLDKLRAATGGRAETRGQVGKSVQEAARGKLDQLRSQYQAAYAKAKAEGADLGPADVSPLKQWLANPTNKRNAGYLSKAIEDYEGRGEKGHFIPKDNVSINNLEEIRKEAVAHSKGLSPEAHYAKEATKVIDKILNDSGSAVYKDARAKFAAVKDEFDRQGRVAGLVKNKGYTHDRAVALEDTFDNVVRKGSNEQLKTVKNTLISQGRSFKGIQAWRDLQAATIDYLKDAAAGKRAIPGEKSQLQFNSSFLDAVYDLDKDGKLDTLFGPGTSAKIREIADATRDVRTKPTGRIAGSDTAPRILSFLEKVSEIPGVGKYVAGIAKVGRRVASLGEETRQAAEAKTDPLEAAAEAAKKAGSKAAKHAHTLKSIRRTAPTATMTLKGDQGP